jgi:hypothetical protein
MKHTTFLPPCGATSWTISAPNCEIKNAALQHLRDLPRAMVEARHLVLLLSSLYKTHVFQSHAVDDDDNWYKAWHLLLQQIYGADIDYADELILQTIREVFKLNINIYSLLDEQHDLNMVNPAFTMMVELFHLLERHYKVVLPTEVMNKQFNDALYTASRSPVTGQGLTCSHEGDDEAEEVEDQVEQEEEEGSVTDMMRDLEGEDYGVANEGGQNGDCTNSLTWNTMRNFDTT